MNPSSTIYPGGDQRANGRQSFARQAPPAEVSPVSPWPFALNQNPRVSGEQLPSTQYDGRRTYERRPAPPPPPVPPVQLSWATPAQSEPSGYRNPPPIPASSPPGRPAYPDPLRPNPTPAESASAQSPAPSGQAQNFSFFETTPRALFSNLTSAIRSPAGLKLNLPGPLSLLPSPLIPPRSGDNTGASTKKQATVGNSGASLNLPKMSAMRVHTPDEILVELSPSPQGSSFLIQAAPTPPPGTALSPPLSQNPFVPALPPRKPVPLASPPAADRPGEAVQVQYRPSTSHRKPVPVTAPPAQVPSRPPTPQRKTAPTPPPPTPPPTTALPLPPNQDPSHPVPLQRKPVPAAPIRQKTPEPLANPVPAFPFSNLPSGNNSTASNWAEYRASSKPALRNVSLVPDATNPRHTATVLAPPVPALPRLNPFRSPPQRKDTQGAPRVLSPPRRKPVENQASVNQPNPSSNSSPTAPTTAPTWGQDPTYPKPPPPVAPGLSFAEPLSSNVEPRASPPRPTSSWYQPNFIPPPPPESTLPNTVYRQSVYRQSIYRQSTVTPKGSPSKPAPPVPPIPQSSPPRGSPPKTSPPVPPIPQSSPPRGSPPRASTARSSPPTRDSPPRRSPPRPSPPVPRAAHVLSESEESTSSQDSVSSTRPLIVHLRQDSVLSNPSRQDTLLNPSRQSTGLSQSTSPSRPSQSRQSSFFSEKRGPRPGNLNTSRTLYMDMLLALDKIPRLHNILVSFFTWIMLVGFVVMTGSFTSGEIAPPDDGTLGTPVNASMLVVGVVFMGMGMIGVGWLGYRWRKNYVWLLNKLYMPLLLNALAGVVATIVSIYAQHGGQWRLQAILTISVEVFVLIVSSLLFAVYNFWFLVRVKGDHHVAIGRDRKSLAQKVNSARKAPPLAPGSVV